MTNIKANPNYPSDSVAQKGRTELQDISNGKMSSGNSVYSCVTFIIQLDVVAR